MNDFTELKEEIQAIKERNKHVEANKAWEKSGTRVGTICVITYVTTAILLYFTNVKYFYLSALIPTGGFFLSTLSLPSIKKWWMKNHEK